MEGKKVLVTGASSGIGRAIALRFADAQAQVLLLDINRDGLGEIKQNLLPAASVYPIDLTSKKQIDEFWESLDDDALPDVIINNAGVYPAKDFLDIDEDFLRQTFAINLESVLWMCQGFIGRARKKGGIIINVSSIEAILPFKKDLVTYSVSKAGVLALTRALARDYGRHNFRVNCILPGAIKTPGTTRLIKQAIQKIKLDLIKTGYDFQNRLALNRWGQPDEVARVALFLASDLASYVQGTIIPVDGGFLSS
jgi:NAD(P)-dependent dehydrogenase (short-subunit alcohol dehydrogenase family)